jgi:eukaryotic-like serine/threonine-protein kinase
MEGAPPAASGRTRFLTDGAGRVERKRAQRARIAESPTAAGAGSRALPFYNRALSFGGATPVQQPKLLLEGKYEILGKIRDGGMGTIYKVRHRLLDEIRVIKVLQPHVVGDAEMKRRFTEEAKTATRLKHPNICTIHDFAIEEDGTAYLVMEFIDGVNLSELLKSTGCPGLPLTLEIAHQALLALAYLHRKDVIHRDVAPDNLMLTHDEEGRPLVKLIDLGIAKVKSRAIDLTATGVFLGKVKYASPEQYGTLAPEEKIDGRSDLFGLGIVLYELLTGVRPFAGESASELLKSHLFLPPLPFAESDPGGRVPPDLCAVILKALEKKRADRYASADEFDREILTLKHRYARPDDIENTLAMISTIQDFGPLASDSVTPGAQDRIDRQFAAHPTPRPSQPALNILPDAARTKRPAERARVPSDGEETLVSPREARPARRAPLSPRPRRAALLAAVSALAVLLGLFGWQWWSSSRPRTLPLRPAATPAPASAGMELRPTAPAAETVAETTAAPTPAPAAAETTPATEDSGRLRQAAGTSREAALRARQNALRARAPELAAALFEKAVRRQQEAERLLAGEDFQGSRAAFEDAASGFRAAESWVRNHPAERPSPVERVAARPEPTAPPAPTFVPPPTAHVEATRIAAAAPTAEVVVRPPTAPPTEPVRTSPSDQEKIREVLRTYERAQDTLDIDLYARVYPGLAGSKRQNLERAWQALAKQQVELDIRQIEVKNSQAVVRAYQRVVATPRIGSELRDARERVFHLERRAESWVIVRLD